MAIDFTSGTVVNSTVVEDHLNDGFGQYKTLFSVAAVTIADASAATYPLGPAAESALGNPVVRPYYFDDADILATSMTQKLRLRAQVSTNGTAWSAVTATFGLYTLASSGAADVLTLTPTIVSGSTVAIANPVANTAGTGGNQGNSGDFTIPADSLLGIYVVLSATLTNNAAALLSAQLQTRSV